jgi:NitT/TauT family transport system substrate-binding protein
MITRRLGLGGALAALAAFGLAVTGCSPKAEAPVAEKKSYTIAWSIYAGWMPWPYADEAGIVKKWADKYNMEIKVIQADYVPTIEQYTAGKVVGVTVTTLDALTLPAASGVDSTVLIVGDYSNGNDGVVLKNGASLAAIKGRPVNFVEFSVSHYLLARALETAKLKFTDIKTVNTSDADIVAAYGTPDVTAVVTWNPQLAEIKKQPGAKEVFNSSAIPGEILDTLVVNSAALEADPDLGKALAGIWYETMAVMEAQTPEGAAAREAMAKKAGTNLADYEGQLKTTFMYYKPADAVAFTKSPELSAATDKVRKFAFDAGLYPKGSASADVIGIQLPDGTVLGDDKNVKLRFNTTYMEQAAAGGL